MIRPVSIVSIISKQILLYDMAQSNTNTLQPSQIPAQIDLLISLHLHLWPALTLAIQNAWGTSSPQISADKRDWFAGAISELFSENQLRDLEDLEDVIDQVMSDEFEVVVDDGTVEETARKIWRGVARVKGGDGAEVQELMQEWERKKGNVVNAVAGQDENQDVDSDEEEDEEWNGFGDAPSSSAQMDVDMDEAPALIDASKTKKPEPEIDEDGFTKVVGKKKR